MIDIETAELSILGSILLTQGRVLEDLDFAPTDYRHPTYEFIHRTMRDMKQAGKPIDPLTVMDALVKSGQKVDPTILHKAVDVTPTAASVQHYASIVTDHATMRRLHNAAGKVQAMVDDGGDADEIMEQARKEIDSAQSKAKSAPVQFVPDTMESTVNFLDSEITFTPTPWASLNRIIDGLKPGALYVIGARPSVGKSVVGLQLARGMAEHGSVAFVSLEMSVNDVNIRLMAADLKIDMRRLMRHELNAEDWAKVGEWVRDNDLPLAINDNTGSSITDIKRFVRNVHRRKPLAGVVVDYLQLMAQQPGDNRPRHEFVADLSRQLKIMAMELDVPVIALSQLNRGSTSREDTRPKISDLRESGAVEQDADVVILLHREIDSDKKYEIDMLVGKNRNGPTGATSMEFLGYYASIRDRSNQ